MIRREAVIINVVPIKKVEESDSLKNDTPTIIPIGTEMYLRGARKLAGANLWL